MGVILYQGHGSFRITTCEGRVLYIDPYAGKGYDLPADAVFVTHEHGDHNCVALVPKKKETRIFRAADFLKNGDYLKMEFPWGSVRGVPACNKNHPIDRCVGFLFEVEGKKLYFAGDTSRTAYMETVLPREGIDVAFFPTDGIYNMDATEASLCARLVGAARSCPIHTAPGRLFDEKVAARFDCPGKTVVRPGEEIAFGGERA